MAPSVRRRGTAVLALAMASGLSLAASIPAGAATTSAPAYYQGVTSANVLSVALNLPVALPVDTGLPQHVALNLIGVTGKAVHNTLASGAKTMSESTATLASGNLTDQLGVSKVIRATLDGTRNATSDGANLSNALLSLNVGPLRANVGQLANTSSANLLKADVLNLGTLLGAKSNGATTTLVKAVQDNVSSVQNTVQSTLNTVVSQVNGAVNQVAPGTPAAQVVDQVQQAVQTVQDKVNTVLNQVLNAGANTSVLKVDTLDASQNIAAVGNAAQSKADTVLANLNLLNGLVTVSGFESHAMAIANGKAGGATATFSGHKPIVAVGTPVLTAALDENGLSLNNVAGLPADVSGTVNGALAQLQSVLNTVLGTLGVSLNYVPGHVDKVDTVGGKYAAATGPEYDVTVANPLDAKNAIAVVGLGHGTTASISAAQAPKHVNLPNPQQGKLPHTGANLPIIAGGGLAFLLGAAYLRRRVSA
jgi:LPXTG-motif cell wall-anchored protein